ncbi:CpcT/CpeT family chromophore lyase [Maricaulaceae bacterium MS644]
MRRLFAVIVAGALSACATPETEPGAGEVFYNPMARAGQDSSLDVVSELAGAWSNAAQYAAAPDDLKRAPAPGHPYDWLDQQYAQFHHVDAPAIGGHVLYLEWRSGDADGEISRQRIWAFRQNEDGVLTGMDFYTFRDPAPYAGLGDTQGAFAGLEPEDLIGYPDGCTLSASAQPRTGLVFEVTARNCVITARSGREMGIEARIEIGPDRIAYQEAGIMAGGGYAFRVPGGPAYDLRRAGE